MLKYLFGTSRVGFIIDRYRTKLRKIKDWSSETNYSFFFFFCLIRKEELHKRMRRMYYSLIRGLESLMMTDWPTLHFHLNLLIMMMTMTMMRNGVWLFSHWTSFDHREWICILYANNDKTNECKHKINGLIHLFSCRYSGHQSLNKISFCSKKHKHRWIIVDASMIKVSFHRSECSDCLR